MELLEGDEGRIARAEGGLETAAVFEDIFAGIPVGKAEVEDGLVVEGGDTAGAGGKAV